MNLFFRIIFFRLSAFFRKRLAVLDVSILPMRVFPTDLDVYGHVNNGRYLTLMDLGRMDWIVRTGLARTCWQKKWGPLVASISIRYRKSLKVFESFDLETRILCWDEKWFFIEQLFRKEGGVTAYALVRGLFRGPEGNIPTAEVLKEAGFSSLSPSFPESVRQWITAEKEIKL